MCWCLHLKNYSSYHKKWPRRKIRDFLPQWHHTIIAPHKGQCGFYSLICQFVNSIGKKKEFSETQILEVLVWEGLLQWARVMNCFRCRQKMSLQPKWEPVSAMENLILMLVISRSSSRDPKWVSLTTGSTHPAPKPHPRSAHSVSCTAPELSLTEKLIFLHFFTS